MTCCGIFHPREFTVGSQADVTGCTLADGHDGPHEFTSEGGGVYNWKTDLCPESACDCDGDYCTTYWRKPSTDNTPERIR